MQYKPFNDYLDNSDYNWDGNTLYWINRSFAVQCMHLPSTEVHTLWQRIPSILGIHVHGGDCLALSSTKLQSSRGWTIDTRTLIRWSCIDEHIALLYRTHIDIIDWDTGRVLHTWNHTYGNVRIHHFAALEDGVLASNHDGSRGITLWETYQYCQYPDGHLYDYASKTINLLESKVRLSPVPPFLPLHGPIRYHESLFIIHPVRRGGRFKMDIKERITDQDWRSRRLGVSLSLLVARGLLPRDLAAHTLRHAV